MSPTLVSTLALVLSTLAPYASASFRLDAKVMITARMDPLIAPGGVSAHVHDIVGGNNFAATYDYDSLRASECSSVNVQDDKSNYWAPAVYYKNRDGTLELVKSGFAVYYLHRGTEKDIQQYPAGLRMIAGSAFKNQSGTDPASKAINFACLGVDGPETLEFPKQHCPNGIRVQIFFPSCWNGKDVTSPNFKDHVSYPVGTHEGGTCPSTHPIRFMSLFIEHILDSGKYEYYDGAFVLAMGDISGYGSHADFQNGWDASPNSVFQQAINTCFDNFASVNACPPLKASLNNDIKDGCKPTTKLPIENVGIYGGLTKLAGDNPFWGQNIPRVLTGVSNTPPFGLAYSSLPVGWKEHGCINEGNIYTVAMTGARNVSDDMYPGKCVEWCDSQGFSMAGLEASNECYCANQLTNGGSMNLIAKSECSWTCKGSLYETCGAGRRINLYVKTGTDDARPTSPYPPAGSKFTTVYTADGSSAPSPPPSGGSNTPTTPEPSTPEPETPGQGNSDPYPTVPKCKRADRLASINTTDGFVAVPRKHRRAHSH